MEIGIRERGDATWTSEDHIVNCLIRNLENNLEIDYTQRLGGKIKKRIGTLRKSTGTGSKYEEGTDITCRQLWSVYVVWTGDWIFGE